MIKMKIIDYFDVVNINFIERKDCSTSIVNEELKIAGLNKQQFSLTGLVENLRSDPVISGKIRCQSLLLMGINNQIMKTFSNLISNRTMHPSSAEVTSDLSDEIGNQHVCHSIQKSVSIVDDMNSKATTISCYDKSGIQYTATHGSIKALQLIAVNDITNSSLLDIIERTGFVISSYVNLALIFYSEKDTVDYISIINILSSLENGADTNDKDIQLMEFIKIMKKLLNKHQNKIIFNFSCFDVEDLANGKRKDIITIIEEFPEVALNPSFKLDLPEPMFNLIEDGCKELVEIEKKEINQNNFIASKRNLDYLTTIECSINEFKASEYMAQSIESVRIKMDELVEETQCIFQRLFNLSTGTGEEFVDEMTDKLSKLFESQVLRDYNDTTSKEFQKILKQIDSKIENMTSQIMQKDSIFPEDVLLLARMQVWERIRNPYLPDDDADRHMLSPVVSELGQRLQYREATMNAQIREIHSSIDKNDSFEYESNNNSPIMHITSANSLNEIWKCETIYRSALTILAEWVQLLHTSSLIESYNSLIYLKTSSAKRVEQLISLFLSIQTAIQDDQHGLIHKVRTSTTSTSDRKLLFTLIKFIHLATIHLVGDYFPYYHLHIIYQQVVNNLTLTILQFLSTIDYHLLHYEFSKMSYGLQFLSDLKTYDSDLQEVLTRTQIIKIELLEEKFKEILTTIKTYCESDKISDSSMIIVENYNYLMDAVCLDDIITKQQPDNVKIKAVETYVTEAQGLINKCWKDVLQSTLQDIETFSFEKLQRDIDQLDSMSILTTVFTEFIEDIIIVVNVMDKKLRLLEFIDINIFIPLQYDKINEFFTDLSNWLVLFQRFQHNSLFTQITDKRIWAESKLKSLSDLYSNIIQHIKNRVDFIKENVSKGFQQFSCEIIKESLDELQNMKVLETSLPNTEIDIEYHYERLKSSIKDALERLVKEAECISQRGEINKYNEIKLFLARTILFSQHITGCDFSSFAHQLSGKYQVPVDRLSKDITTLLQDQRYSDIVTKIETMPSRDINDASKASAYRQVIREISRHIRQLVTEAKEIQRYGEDDVAVNKLHQLFQICCKVNILKQFAENEVNDFINQTIVSCKVIYQRFKATLMEKLAQYDFSMETAVFYDIFCRMKSLDVYLQEIHNQYSDGDQEALYLLEQFDSFMTITIRPLSKYLLEQARRYTGVYMVDNKNASRLGTESGDNNNNYQGPDLISDSSIIRNIDSTHFEEGKLRALIRGAMEATHYHSLFHDTVGFPSLVDQLANLLNNGCSILHKAVDQMIELKDFSKAFTLLDHLRRCVAVYQDNYHYISEPANIQQRSYELLVHSYERAKGTNEFEKFSFFGNKEEVEAFIKKLISLRTSSQDSYRDICFSLYRILGLEKNEFDTLCITETYPLGTDKLTRIFSFMFSLLSYENQIGFQGDHFDKNLLCTRCYQAFQAFLETACSVSHHKVENNEDIEDITDDLNSMTSGLLQLLKQCKDRGRRRWLENTYYDLNTLKIKTIDKISSLRQVEDEFIHFDIQQPQDMIGCISKLQFLYKQSSLHLTAEHSGVDNIKVEKKHNGRFETIIEGLKKQIDNFHISLQSLHTSNQYHKIAAALRNIIALKQISQLKERCEYAETVIKEQLHNIRSQLEDSFHNFWNQLNFKDINQAINKISQLDKAFQDNDLQIFPPLFEAIEQIFLELILSKLSIAYEISSTVNDQAYAIHHLKDFLINIDNPNIHKLVDNSLENLFENLDERSISFYLLGLSLVNLGTLGERIVQTYQPFKAVAVTLYNQHISRSNEDNIYTQLKDGNNVGLSSVRVDSLKFLIRKYNDQIEIYFSQFLPKYSDTYTKVHNNYNNNNNTTTITSIQTIIDKIVSNAKEYTPPFRSSDIIELLAGIFAVYSMHICWNAWEVSKDKLCLFRLTDLEIISICRLIGIDEHSGLIERITSLFSHRKNSLNSHILQIEKSQGKSVILGGLACLLAILGYRVYCLSSSLRLSIKDREPFEDLFLLFGVSDKVMYSTQEGIAENVLNYQGDLSDIMKNRLLRQQDVSLHLSMGNITDLPSLGTVCLLSEGTVLVDNEFYTGIYNLVSVISCECVRHIMDYIWSHRSMPSKLDLENIQSLPEYTTLLALFREDTEELLEQQIQYMLHDVLQYNDPPYLLVDTPSGKLIGYKLHDIVSTSLTYRYRTAFASICESSKHTMCDKDSLYALQIPCGEWSYSELISHFECILGVTSHLQNLTVVERENLKNEYKIDNYTIVSPPITSITFRYAPDLQVNTDDIEVICCYNSEQHYRLIYETIMTEYSNQHPVLILFHSESDLIQFLHSDFGRQLPEFYLITESTRHFSYYASRCKEKGKISLMVESLISDLNSYLPIVTFSEEAISELTIIQTYFTDHPIKDFEIRSLIANQDRKGNFKIILRADLLTTKYGLDSQTMNTWLQSKELYHHLNKLREQLLSQSRKDMKVKVEKAKDLHHTSMRLMRMISDESVGTASITEIILQLASRMDGSCGQHIIFCLDDSGSMMNSWPEVVEAFKCFLTTRLDKGNIHDIISVIQFDHTARVSLRQTSIREAITSSDGFNCNLGGTAYYPVLSTVDNLIESELTGMDVLVVFMTDGDCIDTNEAINKLVELCHKYKERHFQFIGVAFITDGTELQSLTTAASDSGKLVMARDVSELRLCFQDIAREIYASFRT